MDANERQVAGDHYRRQRIQHWDYVAANGLDYFQGQITKYVSRWRDKGGVQDLEKAMHFLQKYIELVRTEVDPNAEVFARVRERATLERELENDDPAGGAVVQDGHGRGHRVSPVENGPTFDDREG